MARAKYVRTLSGVYEIYKFGYEFDENDAYHDCFCIAWQRNGGRFKVTEDNFVKLGWKLEDVVDAYVVEKAGTYTTYKVRDFEKMSHRLLRADIIAGVKYVYAGIWVVGECDEPNLKIVAQMNDEGNLMEIRKTYI